MSLQPFEVLVEQPETPPGGEWLFYQGDRIVGWVSACCCVCAWQEGRQRWPKAQMARPVCGGGVITQADCIYVLNKQAQELEDRFRMN